MRTFGDTFHQQEGLIQVERDDLLKLDNQLCFAIYACSREITRLYRPYLDAMGLTYPQYLALLVLWEQPRLSVNEIGARLSLDSGTLTPMLKRMEAMGLIRRTRDTGDERKVFIELTEKGEQLREQAFCIPENCSPQFGLTFSQYEQLLGQMKDMIAHLQTATREPR